MIRHPKAYLIAAAIIVTWASPALPQVSPETKGPPATRHAAEPLLKTSLASLHRHVAPVVDLVAMRVCRAPLREGGL